MTPRADAEQVRDLHAMSPAAARAWQSYPFIEVPDLQALIDRMPDSILPVLGGPDLPLPWPRFIVGHGRDHFCVSTEFPSALVGQAPNGPRPIFRSLVGDMAMATCWLCVPFGGGFCVAAHVPGDGLKASLVTYSFLQKEMHAAFDRDPEAHKSFTADSKHYISFGTQMAHRVIYHVLHSERHLVEVGPAQPTKQRKGKHHPMPWLRTDLRRIILINPTQAARRYGMPQDVAQVRKSPLPHGRRGHWRRLDAGQDAERRVWVRPAWIGPEAWNFEGQTYRVMAAPQANSTITFDPATRPA